MAPEVTHTDFQVEQLQTLRTDMEIQETLTRAQADQTLEPYQQQDQPIATL